MRCVPDPVKDYFAESRFTAASVVDAIEQSSELKKSVPLALAEKMAAAERGAEIVGDGIR